MSEASEKNNTNSFEKLYLKERKKSRIFMATAIILALLLVGSVVYNFQNWQRISDQPTNTTQNFSMPFGQDRGGFQRLADIKSFFKSDGSVDTAKVDELKSSLPSGFEDRFLDRFSTLIDTSMNDGEITQSQGSELKRAFGIEEGNNGV